MRRAFDVVTSPAVSADAYCGEIICLKLLPCKACDTFSLEPYPVHGGAPLAAFIEKSIRVAGNHSSIGRECAGARVPRCQWQSIAVSAPFRVNIIHDHYPKPA